MAANCRARVSLFHELRMASPLDLLLFRLTVEFGVNVEAFEGGFLNSLDHENQFAQAIVAPV
jgi:hypothetical protein